MNADDYGVFEIEMIFQYLVTQPLYGDSQLLFVQDRLHFIKISKKEETSVAGLSLQTIQTFFKTLKQLFFAASAEHIEYAYLDNSVLAVAAIGQFAKAKVVAGVETEVYLRDQVAGAESPGEISRL